VERRQTPLLGFGVWALGIALFPAAGKDHINVYNKICSSDNLSWAPIMLTLKKGLF
jgi:hypothetical protein